MAKFSYQCVNCNEEFITSDVIYLCPNCSESYNKHFPPKGILKVNYNYSEIFRKYKEKVFIKLKKTAFLDLFPLDSLRDLSFLNIGNTPLYKINRINDDKLKYDVYLKDDSTNPTFSFKDRASNIVSAWAKEHNIQTICAASTGNAGSSLAGICASQNQKAIIFVPASAPKAKLTQIIMYGATIVPIDGNYDDAFDLSIEATNEFGWYNRNTAYNPFTIEGKKTVAFELFDQLQQSIPDKIFVPVGDGVIISGVYKGFEDLLKLKIIEKIPTIVAVQALGSSNLIDNLESNSFILKPSETIADSISVDIPRNFYMTKDYLLKYNGECIKISDQEIMSASKTLSSNYGLFSEPAAAAAFAGLLKYKKANKLKDNSKNVVLLTGNGLKDLSSVQSIINIPEAIKPNIDKLKEFKTLKLSES